MSTTPQADKPALTIRDLYPTLRDEQLKEAEENLERYIALALSIYERICADPELYAKFRHLTASKAHPSMHDTKVGPSNNLHPSSKS
jgi:hypothetical protein